jgi:DNA-binding MarR family transcriptional regulator
MRHAHVAAGTLGPDMAAVTARDANLLGALALAVSGRMLVGPEAARLGPSGAAAVVAVASWLRGATIEELSRTLGLSHSATVRLVDRLERDGIVERRPGPDARSVALRVTRRGARVADRLLRQRAEALEDVLGVLSRADRNALAGLHAALLAGITDSRATARHVCRLCDLDGCGHHEGRCPVTRAAAAAGA